MRTRARGALALTVTLSVLLVAGGVAAWSLGYRSFDGVAPAGAAPAVPARGAGSPVAELSADARAHPAGEAVRAQLQRYFDAINAHDYAAWTTTVVRQRVEQQPRTQWLASLDTTTDGTIRIDRVVDLDGGRVLALVRFISTQDLSDAPAGLQAARICWRGALPMSGSPLRLEVGNAGSLLGAAC
ncbi:hypothetical protein [Pseudonocardia acidicola]|uniref:Mce-associated membrane protein n=1 Tax=Pseudonocardia acidicola TaxID=2724939 RepID=A0ABX1S2W0_9PSEU|nr:hypothetical protein [Pseudonocardia acidicola]NMH95888.1 hypothetical protein [Pseudonocardia acidicola]